MELPTIPHRIRDAERKVEYVVMAYRQLTRGEVVATVRNHLATTKRKPKPNTRVTLVSLLGATDNL